MDMDEAECYNVGRQLLGIIGDINDQTSEDDINTKMESLRVAATKLARLALSVMASRDRQAEKAEKKKEPTVSEWIAEHHRSNVNLYRLDDMFQKAFGQITQAYGAPEWRQLEERLVVIANPVMPQALPSASRWDAPLFDIEKRLTQIASQYQALIDGVSTQIDEASRQQMHDILMLMDILLREVRLQRREKAGVRTKPKQENPQWLIDKETLAAAKQRKEEKKT
ncbi:MAG: hypothetical protein GY854_16705, partial [Deltaproteobacteria bacterium]|nr:hypothetical protein [Deltaproteobacteria bacterium]